MPRAHEQVVLGTSLQCRLGVRPGRQIRLTNDHGPALYTVRATGHDERADTAWLTTDGLDRLGARPETTGVDLSLDCVHPTLTSAQARRDGELVETVQDTATHNALLALAPHGGDIERWTDSQASRLVEVFGIVRSTAWICQGWRPGASAYKSWHISSNDLDPQGFPLLRRVSARRFEIAIAFHGSRGDSVIIGGAAPRALKAALRDAISNVVAHSGIAVMVARTDDRRYAGTHSSNLVNRLGQSGIQIEQCLTARRRHWRAIADAVSGVLAP